MAITRPTSKSIISTTQWGIPITDAVNANTTDIAGMKPGAWTALPFVNGWSNAYPSTAGQYRKVGDMVQFRGRITNASNVLSGNIATMPVGFRSRNDETVTAGVHDGGKWNFAMIDISSTSGNLSLNTLAGAMVWLSFNFQYSTV